MNRETFIKIINFMILGIGVLVLGWGQNAENVLTIEHF